jgi:hypothetical protein
MFSLPLQDFCVDIRVHVYIKYTPELSESEIAQYFYI